MVFHIFLVWFIYVWWLLHLIFTRIAKFNRMNRFTIRSISSGRVDTDRLSALHLKEEDIARDTISSSFVKPISFAQDGSLVFFFFFATFLRFSRMTSPRCTCLQCASTDGAFFSFLSSTPRSPATLASPRSLPWWAQDQIPELPSKLVDASTSHQNSPQVQHAAVGGQTALQLAIADHNYLLTIFIVCGNFYDWNLYCSNLLW